MKRLNVCVILAWILLFGLSGCATPVGTQRERKTSLRDRGLNAQRQANEAKQAKEAKKEPTTEQILNSTHGVQIAGSQITSTAQEQLQAMADARRDARLDFNPTKWGCMGGFGAAGLAASAIHEPPIPLHRLQGKSETYILYYKEEYVQEMKRLQSSSAFEGWIVGMIAVFAGIAILTILAQSQ